MKSSTGKNTYGCFSEKGASQLPLQEEITARLTDGIEPIIFLDSCVCLHIVKVVEYGKKATGVDLQRIIALKEYLSKSQGIRINPVFGFMELCLKSDGRFDREKFRDFKYMMDFFEQVPLKAFRQFSYDFRRDMAIFRDPTANMQDQYNEILALLKKTYCSLLKIRRMAQLGTAKAQAEQNLEDLFEWMHTRLDSIRGPEYKLAMNIFGGNTAYRKMIGLDNKPSDVRKKLMGTSWDFFHAKNCTNSFRLFEMLQKNIWPFFLTSDANLFNIFRGLSLSLVKDGGSDYTSAFMMASNFDFPHLSEQFIDRQNEKAFKVFVDRRNHVSAPDGPELDLLIRELEAENGMD